MTPFEYVVVLISIILGLGITQIMTGVADLVHQWYKVKLYWTHLVWIVLVFVLHIQEWWLTYNLRDVGTWRLPIFLFITLYPVNLFILARILFPFNPPEGAIDLKIFYYANFRKFFLVTMILNVLSVIQNVTEDGVNPSQLLIVSILVVLGWVALRKDHVEWVHKAIAIGLLLTLVISALVNWNVWLIG